MNFVGIDVGASTTKSVIINEKKEILGYAINNSGADFKAAAVEQKLKLAVMPKEVFFIFPMPTL